MDTGSLYIFPVVTGYKVKYTNHWNIALKVNVSYYNPDKRYLAATW